MNANIKEPALQLRRAADSSIQTNTSKTILQGYNLFIREYCAARLYSQKTIEGYWWAIKSFVDHMGNVNLDGLDHTTYSLWVTSMYEKGNSKITIHTNVSRFRVFVDYAHLQGWCKLTKDDIRVPKKPKTIVKYARRDEIDELIRHANCVRNRAIIAVMFSTGLRASELRNLKKSNIDIDHSELRVEHGKGDKEAILFLDDRARELTGRYWLSRTDGLPWAFVAGEGECAGKIASSTLRYIFDTTCKRAGLTGISPKAVRHGFGTELMRQKVHMRSIQEAMRHEFITTTQIYTHVEQGDLKEEVLHALNNR